MNVSSSWPMADHRTLGFGVGVGLEFEFEAALVEAAVLRAVDHRAEAGEFHAERDPLYEVADAEAREEAFRLLHGRWFVRLGLDAPVRQALAEQPSIAARTRGCRIATAAHRRAEGADLALPAGRLPGTQRPLVVVRLRATTLLDAPALRTLLRRELLHVSDMLAPEFGYEPEVPPPAGGPAHAAVFVERYRVLWETCVAGRMLRRGWLGEEARARALERFAAVFTLLDGRVESEFARWFACDTPTHREMVASARADLDAAGHPNPGA